MLGSPQAKYFSIHIFFCLCKMSLTEREDTDISVVTAALDEKNAACRESPEVEREKLTDFPKDFNQLELLETHRHLIPTGTQSLWTAELEEEDEEVEDKNEEWSQSQENKELILFAAENNRGNHSSRHQGTCT
ncbi:hypothetical protein XELAEV_18016328mg [Xenopus laevis]|uniref:Uncharacterized protein n=1 Tax=Xenopus laevis TaxID=8355 RepID=A0A974DKB8_XENLA|nr:hypothetical protein XELAEV_18016328mg [Xenopus laevis]